MTPPTTSETKDNIVNGLQASIGQTIPILPKAFSRVLAAVLAGVFILLWKYVGFLGLQQFVSKASGSATTINGKVVIPLVEWGRLFGVGDPNPAQRAQLVIAVPVKLQSGNLPSGSRLVRAETGVIYQTVAAIAMDAPTVQVTVRAISDQSGGDGSGAIGNLQPGDVVSFSNTPLNVGSECTVVSQLVTGADAEDIEAYRSRVVDRVQAKPQGGAAADYRVWAEEVPGIVAVYPYAGDPGEVNVFCEATPASSGSLDGFLTPAQIAAVNDSISLDIGGVASRVPVNAAFNVFSIARTSFDVRVHSLTVIDAVTTQSLIAAGVDEYFRSLEPFIVGISVLPRKDRVTQAGVSAVVDSIAASQGGTVSSVDLLEGGSQITARSLGHGEKAKLGAIIYV